MNNKEQKNTAIVIGYKGINSTGLIRSLGLAGYNVTFASSYSKIESKWTTSYLYLPEDEDEMIDTLCKYISSLPNKPALFTGDDKTNEFLEKYHSTLDKICYCPNANGKLLHISDKSVMSEIARESGLNVPESIKLNLNSFSKSPIIFPVIIKPYAGYAGRKTDIRVCRTEEEYSIARKELLENGYSEVLVQKLIDYPHQKDVCVMGYSLPGGLVKIVCAVLKIRSYPMGRGSLSFGKVENLLDEDIKKCLGEFVSKTGYIGIFDIDLLVCDNKIFFIEINYRNGQNGFIPTLAGYNIPDNWFRGMQGIDTDEIKDLNEVYYQDERGDFNHVKEGNISFKRWLQDFRQSTVHAMYCKGDQRPFWRQYVRFPERWKRRLKRFFHVKEKGE